MNPKPTGYASSQKKKIPEDNSQDQRQSENVDPQANSRERRPSDKLAAQSDVLSPPSLSRCWLMGLTVEDKQEAEKLKADKEERIALRKKKALQKVNQQTGNGPATDDEYEPRANPLV